MGALLRVERPRDFVNGEDDPGRGVSFVPQRRSKHRFQTELSAHLEMNLPFF